MKIKHLKLLCQQQFLKKHITMRYNKINILKKKILMLKLSLEIQKKFKKIKKIYKINFHN